MRSIKWTEIKSKMLYVLIGMLILSNYYFYSQYTILKRNTDYVSSISSRINFSKAVNNIDPLVTVSANKEKDYLTNVLQEVVEKSASGYSLENYIVIKYDNGNTLLVKTTQNDRGIFLIQDLFFLDEKSIDRLKYSKEIDGL